MKANGKYPSGSIKKTLGIIIVAIICAFNYNAILKSNLHHSNISISLFDNKKELTIEDEILEYAKTNDSLFSFYSDTFQIEKSEIINRMILAYSDCNTFNEYDLFNTGNNANSADESLVSYLLDLEKSEPKLFSNKKTPCNKSTEYILALIDYFGSIYTNVDTSIAKAIGLVESGYRSKYMMNNNNVFGGMYSGGLIPYKNINYGILKYMELLSKGYFGKELNTIEKIGYKYNPTIDDNGNKIASPTWVANVRNYTKRYEENKDISIEYLTTINEN